MTWRCWREPYVQINWTGDYNTPTAGSNCGEGGCYHFASAACALQSTVALYRETNCLKPHLGRCVINGVQGDACKPYRSRLAFTGWLSVSKEWVPSWKLRIYVDIVYVDFVGFSYGAEAVNWTGDGCGGCNNNSCSGGSIVIIMILVVVVEIMVIFVVVVLWW